MAKAARDRQSENTAQSGRRLKVKVEELHKAREEEIASLEARISDMELMLADIGEVLAHLLVDRTESSKRLVEIYDRPVGDAATKRIEAVFSGGNGRRTVALPLPTSPDIQQSRPPFAEAASAGH